MAFEIRAGTRDDAEAIARVHIESWRGGYRGMLPDEVLDSDEFEASRRDMWTSWRFNPGQRVTVCVGATRTGETIIGFAAYGPERERVGASPVRGEVYACYFLPEAWGDGSASALIDHVDERLRAEGFADAVLWVMKNNPRARAFYEKHGWKTTGRGNEYTVGDARLPEIEYRKELT
jgi:ribosomal protein S18 acetylase RimI-like enzyme